MADAATIQLSAAHALRGTPVRIQRACVPRMADAAAIQTAADAVLAQKKMLLSPALATSNVAKLGEEAAAATAAGADCLHFNVMDGHFTEKLTWGPMMVKALRAYGIEAPIDVQLTATADIVDVQIEEFAAAGANYITFHAEGSRNIDRSLGLISSLGLKCGVVLNPSTPTSYLENIMAKVDIILLMSNNPGFKNQKFQEGVYEKAKKVRAMIDASGRDIRLEVDGGAGLKNIEKLASCGIDMFVVGRGVFHADDYGAAVTELKALAEKGAASRK